MPIHSQPAQVPERYQQGPQLLLPTVSVQAMVSGWMGMVMESANGQV